MIGTQPVRTFAVRMVAVAAIATALVTGFTCGEVSAAKYVAINCSSLYSSALYAGGQWQAADRRGDTVTADFWWSIYNSLELSYARNCTGDMAS